MKKFLPAIFAAVLTTLLCLGGFACAKKEYTVNFIDQAQQYSSQTLQEGQPVEFPVGLRKEEDGQYTYQFLGWSFFDANTIVFSEEEADLVNNYFADRDLTFYSVYLATPVEIKFTVQYRDDDGNLLSEQKVVQGQDATPPPAPTKEGYKFVGWSNDGKNITGRTTIYAQFQIESFDLRLHYLGQCQGSKLEYGSQILPTKPQQTDSVLIFGGWYLDEDFQNEFQDGTLMGAKALDLYAKYTVDFSTAHVLTHSSTYGTAATASVGGLIPSANVQYTFSWTDQSAQQSTSFKNAGTHPFSVTITANYADGAVVDSKTLSGQVEVQKANLSISLSCASFVYGATPKVNISVSGAKYDDANAIKALVNYKFLNGNEDFDGDKFEVATYQVQASVSQSAVLENYNLQTIQPVSFSVSKAQLQVEVNGVKNIIFGQNLQPELQFTGFVNGDDKSCVLGQAQFVAYAEQQQFVLPQSLTVGTYSLQVEGLSCKNYDLVYPQTLSFQVLKADYTDVEAPKIDTQVMAFNRKLGDIQLPEGYHWIDQQQLIKLGENQYLLYYNADPQNYKDITLSATITARRERLTVSASEVEVDFGASNEDVAKQYSYTVTNEQMQDVQSGTEYKFSVNITNNANFTVGSTYTIEYAFSVDPQYSDVFEFETNIVYKALKIKSVFVDNAQTFYTIEDALNTAGKGTIKVLFKANTSFISPEDKAKLNIYNSDAFYTIKQGVTLLLPYNEAYSNTEDTRTIIKSVLGQEKYRMQQLLLPADTILYNQGTIVVGGITTGGNGGNTNGAGQTSGEYAQLTMGKNAQIVSTGTMKVYGFVVEQEDNNGSQIQLNQGTLQQPFVVVEHRGGAKFYGIHEVMETLETSPFNRFYMENVDCKLSIAAGASLEGLADLFAADQENKTTIKLVGNTNESLIQLGEQSSVLAKFDKNSYKTSLQIVGDATINAMTLKISLILTTFNLSTESVLFPISWYFDITLSPSQSGQATVNSPKQSFKIMPGGSLTIEKGVTFNVKDIIVYDQNYKDPQDTTAGEYSGACSLYESNKGAGVLMVNGTLNVEKIGGLVQTNTDMAVLNVKTAASKTSYEVIKFTGKDKIGFFIITKDVYTIELDKGGWYEYKQDLLLALNQDGTVQSPSAQTGLGKYVSSNGGWIYQD